MPLVRRTRCLPLSARTALRWLLVKTSVILDGRCNRRNKQRDYRQSEEGALSFSCSPSPFFCSLRTLQGLCLTHSHEREHNLSCVPSTLHGHMSMNTHIDILLIHVTAFVALWTHCRHRPLKACILCMMRSVSFPSSLFVLNLSIIIPNATEIKSHRNMHRGVCASVIHTHFHIAQMD